MAYIVALLSTRWGSELGGLNVFNKGLAEGIALALPIGSQTICFVNKLPSNAGVMPNSVELLEHAVFSPATIANDIVIRCNKLEAGTLQGVLVVGHDVVTGHLAVECASQLRSLLSPESDVKSAVIGHMDYSAYAFMKNLSLVEVAERSKKQREIIAAADCAFAVGPLLQHNFASARRTGNRPSSPVRPLLPGAEKIKLQPHDQRVDLRFFISGRLNSDDDPIKNSVLAIHALAAAYLKGRELNSKAWHARGQLFAWGVDPESDEEQIAQLKGIGSKDSAFTLHAQPFSDDQLALRERLASCHLALMPSWHEGFGLSGWEAICAGVPLVCSRQSGLAMFLDELKQQFPNISLASVEFVNVNGSTSTGDPSDDDVQRLAEVLLDIVNDIEARKQSALELASLLKREFSWKRCASDLLEDTGWHLPGSVHWSNRQIVGQQKVESRLVLERILGDLDELDLDDDWRDLTTAFNHLSDAGKTADLRDRAELLDKLRLIGSVIGDRMRLPSSPSEGAKNSGHMDVCWRYMAACSNLCATFREFSQSFPEAMLQAIWKDSFLTKELIYYSTVFSSEFPHQASDFAEEFFLPIQSVSDPTISMRLARLASKAPEIRSLFPKLESDAAFSEESTRCDSVVQNAYDIGQKIADDPNLASTVLALMGLSTVPARQMVDQTVAFIRNYFPDAGKVSGHWRGDKRVFAALATATLSTNTILQVLQCMALDEDESIRWAALHLAFSATLRQRLEAAATAKSLPIRAPLNQVLGSIVDAAVSFDGGHPWLHREFLNHYREEHSSSSTAAAGLSRLRVQDFPLARWLIGPVLGDCVPSLDGKTHPEVATTRTDTLQVVKRILLVLPPIEIDDAAVGASRTSTPPLGLGLLASHLSAEGHDVQIADCHRFPNLRSEVIRLARTFDLIGFNSVFSTINSTMTMLVDIRNRTQSTTLVVGGPAAKLNAWQFSTVHNEDAQKSWDFAIATDAVENLSALVTSLRTPGPWPAAPGMIPNPKSWNVVGRGVNDTTQTYPLRPLSRSGPEPESAWLNVSLDRRVYRNADEQYEPARTRSKAQNFHEAHVVMSQGCDWNCTFCTERRDKSGGERRRNVDHVLDEITALASQYSDLRIQFVDDNLLPQIASNMKGKYEGLAWATNFLDGMVKVREAAGDSFGWRGIFRIEDFIAYEEQLLGENFVLLLQRSGCRMLAFGVEHGNEEQRRKSKAASKVLRNDEIYGLFKRLQSADILTKAYFMLGGQWEDQGTAQQTIDFAINSGVTLAYFALYKDFSRASSVLSKEQQADDPKSKGYIFYDQLVLNWDKAFASRKDGLGNDCVLASGEVTETELECYRQLAAMGFQFSDLVKYNDFHDADADGGKLLNAVTWGNPEEYFKSVELAYRRFYLRPAFVQQYSALLAHGY